jgi:purine-binding chemotaxis protein CheW
MNQSLFLFATIADTPLAVCASEVEAVVRLGDVVPIPLAPAHVRGLAALRSRVLTVIDMEARIFGKGGLDDSASLAIIANISAHSYGFLVDSVSDICLAAAEPQPVYGRIDPAWAPFVAGLVEHDGSSHLLVTLGNFATATSASTFAA